VEDEILELVKPSLLYADDCAAFVSRFRGSLQPLGLELSETSNGGVSAQQLQRRHFDWYAQNEDQTYNAYQKSPFWVAFDAATFAAWSVQIQPGGIILDVGCADGRSCFPFVNRGNTIIGFDISKALVRQAITRATTANAQASTTFFVSDASVLPFRDNTVDYIVIYGVLHHVPNPRATCREVYRILKPGGVYLGSENNVSMFRGIFDLLMKLKPIWKEEAGDQPLISCEHIQQWLQDLPILFSCRSSVFLPPQLLNLLGHRNAAGALALSDKLCTAVPGLREQGGLIVFEVRKQLPRGAATV
jgi:ubiquinone/menaquinone biosynthesis C-methylase UbiE